MERSYRDKLIQFNSTEKYRLELMFLKALVEPEKDELIVDFGCGIGTAVNHLQEKSEAKILGHDVNEYFTVRPDWFRSSIYFPMDKVYFMHSLAHVGNIAHVLESLNGLLAPKGRIIVITPNKNWLKAMRNDSYVPDSTVVGHYDMNGLVALFQDFDIVNSGGFGEPLQDGHEERIFIVAQKR